MASKPLQVVFSFDTTGSMAHALVEVRKRISDMVQKLKSDIPGVTIAIVAHGDYCDRDKYITKHIDFTDHLSRLVSFVNTVQDTYGGDAPEAYEVMLRLVRRDISWTSGSQRILVVIGDSYPHPPDFPDNTDRIDCKEEVRMLADMGIRIYGVQVQNDMESTQFFQRMAEKTKGFRLTLEKFASLCDVIMAICYREKGVKSLVEYEYQVRAREGAFLASDLEEIFKVLRDVGVGAAAGARPALDKEEILKSLRDAKLI